MQPLSIVTDTVQDLNANLPIGYQGCHRGAITFHNHYCRCLLSYVLLCHHVKISFLIVAGAAHITSST
jgi:hypothetical protein